MNARPRTICYELMRPQEIVAARTAVPVAYVPIGPLEWHGPHLPFGVDLLHAHSMALEAARRTGGVVLPPLPLGSETLIDEERLRHRGFSGTERVTGMDFPGFGLLSLYTEESVFGLAVRDIVRGLRRQEFKVIVLTNGHGAPNHRAALARVAAEESDPGRVAVLTTGPMQAIRYRGHAERGETSYMLACHAETVDLGALPPAPAPLHNLKFGILDGPTCAGRPAPDFTVNEAQDPRFATAEQGRDDLEYEANRIADAVREALTAVTAAARQG
jgi:creatinine amidohydrolase